MKYHPTKILVIVICAAIGMNCFALETTVDTQSAREVLQALRNSTLNKKEALRIAALPGNQGLVRKANSYHIDTTTETFAEALLSAAHGEKLTTPTAKYLRFNHLKKKANLYFALITRIEKYPDQFRGWVTARVMQFSPVDSTAHLEGFLVLGGSSGGFSFDEPKFYLNLAYFDEYETAKVIMAHELYHAVQGVYGIDQEDNWLKPEAPTAQGKAQQHMCASLANLFTNLYQEGSASYVGDPLLLSSVKKDLAVKISGEMQAGIDHIGAPLTILELSVTGIEAPKPVPFDDIYSLGFYVPEPLYKVGYLMAKAIATDQSSESLAAHLSQPSYTFVQHYTDLPNYGKDAAHPKLGDNTINAAKLLANGCNVIQ